MDVSSPTPDWSATFTQETVKTDIVKVESTIDGPPPSPTTSLYTPATSATPVATRQRSNTSIVPPRRLRPYPSTSRLATPDSPDMTAVPSYHQPWTIRSRLDPEDTSYFAFSDPLSPQAYLNHRTLEHRPHSSSSSLTNAMGEPQYTVQRPSPPRKGYTIPYQSDWQGVDHAQQSGSYVHPNTNGTNSPHLMQMPSTYSPLHSNPSSGSVSSPSPPFSVATFGQQDDRFHPAAYQPAAAEVETELRMLRKRVRELERMNEQAIAQIKSLHSDVTDDKTFSHHANGLIPSPSMQASWKARTSARIRIFCSLNRAGNALCAWHDSRRERRAHPPRMAPPGYLNCGCTFEEALFEESLARHNVGSYHPGENVRMDPALRNPLLKLMQARYGYRDGDFERDPVTGEWLEGEGHQLWEQKAQSGVGTAKRAQRGESNNDRGR